MEMEYTYATGTVPSYAGKELASDLGINSYDFTARWQYPMAGAFTSPDALAHKMPWLSPYAFCGGDPINLSDPTGLSTEVELLEDGTYKVIGGNLNDNDLNIYVVTKDENNNNIRGESIGQTLTLTSFYDTEISQWKVGSIIDLSDNSGQNFLTDLKTSNLDVATYASQAYGGQKYDFKATNGNGSSYEKDQHYRGMPIETADGRSVIASARDIGNYAAGYVAGVNGISWNLARVGFDTLESIQHGTLAKECMTTQYAQFSGWSDGIRDTNIIQRFVNFFRLPFSSIIK